MVPDRNELVRAVHDDDDATVARCLARSDVADGLRFSTREGDTLLHIAARCRRPRIVKRLIDAGAAVNAPDASARTPLLRAMDVAGKMPEELRCSRALFYDDADCCQIDPAAESWLQPDATTAVVEILVEAGADLSGLARPWRQLRGVKRETYRPPLTLAAKYGYDRVLRLLVSRGAELDAVDGSGETALMEAIWWENVKATRLLIAAGADVNRVREESGDTPLLMVIQDRSVYGRIREARVGLTRSLIEADANVHVCNRVGDAALLAAVRAGTDWALSLQECRELPLGEPGYETVQVPRQGPRISPEELKQIVMMLKTAGAPLTMRDHQGKTARQLAVEGSLAEIAALL